MTFNGQGSHVVFTVYRGNSSFGESGSLQFKTRASDGVIMYAARHPIPSAFFDFVSLVMLQGQLQLQANLGSGKTT